MNLTRSKILQVVAGTSILIGLPLLLFPELFGAQLLRASWHYLLYEIVFYGFVAVPLFRCTSLVDVLKVAGLSLAYRLGIGALFGLAIAALYAMDFQVAMTLALFSYVPGLAVQIVLTPLALLPVLRQLAPRGRGARSLPRREPTHAAPAESAHAPFPGQPARERNASTESQARPRDTRQPEAPLMHSRAAAESNPVTVTADLNGFERAVRYIAEHGSVYFVAVIDQEGLLLANYYRGKIDPQDMAPLAVMFFEWNRAVLEKGRLGDAEKIDITLKEKRLILGRIGDWCMMVMSERQADDLLNIRINQGLDMLKKYVAERYGAGRQTEVEKTYV